MMCNFSTSWKENDLKIENLDFHLNQLKELEKDGLVIIKKNGIKIPNSSRPFVRNICMAFDKKIHQKKIEKQLFSMTI